MRYFESQNSEKAIYVKSLLKVGYVSLYIILVDNLY